MIARSTILALSVLFLLVAASRAYAQTAAKGPEDSDALIAEGIALRQEGHDAEALALFRRAEVQHVTPRSRAQVGLASEALEHWVEAEKALRDALAGSGDPWIEKYRGVLEQELDALQRKLGWVDVSVDVPGAELWLEGVHVGAFPLPVVRAPVGLLDLEVRAPGYAPIAAQIEVHPGEFARRSFTLARLPPESPLAPGGAPLTEPAPRSSPLRTAAWLSLAGSGLALAGGVAAHVWREDQADYWNSDACQAPGHTRQSQCGSVFSDVQVGTALAITGYGLAGALGATSAYLFFRSGKSSATQGSMAALPLCAPGPGTLVCAMAF
jgi:hypothetical protein